MFLDIHKVIDLFFSFYSSPHISEVPYCSTRTDLLTPSTKFNTVVRILYLRISVFHCVVDIVRTEAYTLITLSAPFFVDYRIPILSHIIIPFREFFNRLGS